MVSRASSVDADRYLCGQELSSFHIVPMLERSLCTRLTR